MAQPDPRTESDLPDQTDAVFALLYRELHGLAGRLLTRQGGAVTLGTTTLLHELYLDLAHHDAARFPDRLRFMSYASRAMRGLIVDYTRRRSATKRGGEFLLLPLGTEAPASAPADAADLEELSVALDGLSTIDPSLTELVDLHFFCGLSFMEIATLRGVSDRTIQRDWRKARLILRRHFLPSDTA